MTTATVGSVTGDGELPAISRRKRALIIVTGRTARVWSKAAAWRIAAPGLAGAGLISAGVALKWGVWAGLIGGGLFLLRLDHRL